MLKAVTPIKDFSVENPTCLILYTLYIIVSHRVYFSPVQVNKLCDSRLSAVEVYGCQVSRPLRSLH